MQATRRRGELPKFLKPGTLSVGTLSVATMGTYRGTHQKPPNRGHPIHRVDIFEVRRYLTFMKTTISSKGQIVLPAELRREDGVEPGDQFEVKRLDEGEYVLRRVSARPNRGLVTLLRACPEDDWFVPVDRDETTDEVSVADLG